MKYVPLPYGMHIYIHLLLIGLEAHLGYCIKTLQFIAISIFKIFRRVCHTSSPIEQDFRYRFENKLYKFQCSYTTISFRFSYEPGVSD